MPAQREGGGPRIAVVLGGGGMKGFAHIGVLRALAELSISPSLFAGTSIGALFAAAAAAGGDVADLAARATALKRRDLFRIDRMGMLMERMRSPSIYLEEPLRELVDSVVPEGTFRDLPMPLFVNTVDIERATQVIWGTPGLDNASVRDAVYSSCALPGFLPPGQLEGRTCVDGGVVDNLPVQIAGLHADLLIAVDVGNSEMKPITNALARGFANIYMRAASTMMHSLQLQPLLNWEGPPMILVRPRIEGDWLSFSHTEASIAEGYRAAHAALQGWERYVEEASGVFPRRTVHLDVVRERCVCCGLCAAIAPSMMGLDSSGKAFARAKELNWSPADGDFVYQCPTRAIVATTRDHPELAQQRVDAAPAASVS